VFQNMWVISITRYIEHHGVLERNLDDSCELESAKLGFMLGGFYFSTPCSNSAL
jgi:hypothetical protein